jgi:hypothetical protein
LKRTFLLLGASKSPAADEKAGWTRRPLSRERTLEKKEEETMTLLRLLAIIVAHKAAGPL